MKTGQFSKKHNVSQSMVVFYIKQGLLLPTITNGRYDFKETDDEDMLIINSLKKWKFSLDNISEIVSEIRLNKNSARPSSDKLLMTLIKKRRELFDERARINTSLLTLDQIILSLESALSTNKQDQDSGMGVEFLPYLSCPVCLSNLTVNLERIDSGQIHNGRLTCSCGYNGAIEDGLLISPWGEGGLEDTQDAILFPPIDELLSEERNILFKVYNCLDEMLKAGCSKDKLVLETYICNNTLLLSQAKSLCSEANYILSDCSYETVIREKERIGKLGKYVKLLNIVGNRQCLPLKPGCVDFYIDCFQNTYLGSFSQALPYLNIKHYLHPGSKIIGVFIGLSPGARSKKVFKGLYPQSCPEIHDIQGFKKSLSENGFIIQKEYLSDPLLKSSLPWHQDNDELKLYCYCATMNP